MVRLLGVVIIILFLLVFKLMDEVGASNDRISQLVAQHIESQKVFGDYQAAYWCEHKRSPKDACGPRTPPVETIDLFRTK